MTIKARKTVHLFTIEAIADQIINAVNLGFEVSTAIGVQLDIIGRYVNAYRSVLGITIPSDFFDMNTYDNVAATAHGFAYYTEDPTSYFLTYDVYLERTYRISDTLLRSYISIMANINKINPTLKECDDLLFSFFGNSVTITDNEDMTIDYEFTGTDNLELFQILAVSDKLPRPAGVGVTINYV